MADITRLSIEVASAIRERSRRIEKRLKCSFAQIVREALTERVEHYEAKFRAEDALARQERDERRRGVRSLRSLGDEPSPLAPGALRTLEPLGAGAREASPPAVERDDRDGEPLDEIYIAHARRIAEVLEHPSPMEKRLRIGEALTAIKRYAPLTHPSDGIIMAKLERLIITMGAQRPVAAPPPAFEPPPPYVERFVDELVGRTFNPTKVPTFGDVVADDK